MKRHLLYCFPILVLSGISCFGPLDPYDWPPDAESSDDTTATGGTSDAGLVAYWSCDDTSGTALVDSVGGLRFSLSGAVSAEGKVGKGVKFNGKDDYAVLSDTADEAIRFGTDDFTISLLVQPQFYQEIPDTVTPRFDILSRGVIYEKGYTIAIAEESFTALVGRSKNEQRDTTFDASVQDWYHVVLLRRNTTVELWVNTKKILSYTNDEDISAADSKLMLGNNAQYDSKIGFPGIIDEIRMYKKALDSSKIKSLYSTYFN